MTINHQQLLKPPPLDSFPVSASLPSPASPRARRNPSGGVVRRSSALGRFIDFLSARYRIEKLLRQLLCCFLSSMLLFLDELLHIILPSQWENHAWKDQFKYDVTTCQMKLTAGGKLITELNGNWNSNVIVDENKMFQSASPNRASYVKPHREDLFFVTIMAELLDEKVLGSMIWIAAVVDKLSFNIFLDYDSSKSSVHRCFQKMVCKVSGHQLSAWECGGYFISVRDLDEEMTKAMIKTTDALQMPLPSTALDGGAPVAPASQLF
ncbi:hypothetical protein OPV22_024478 [Ensete ventricosum]|uniref:GDPGP1-like N-terminal domain-containing protein n=1 Tax=Ensete ventricosum TaxID=4639 RepID=A0AAV8QF32_ENSVE|nr:hypothetical protein OPV22_024478 [Ensete ventricosum]